MNGAVYLSTLSLVMSRQSNSCFSVAAQTGGRKGGGAQLTAIGLAVVSRFRAIERAATAAAATHMDALQAEIDAG